MQNRIENCSGCSSFESLLTCRHLVNSEAEREQIAARIDRFPQGLLWRHVRHRSQRCARTG